MLASRASSLPPTAPDPERALFERAERHVRKVLTLAIEHEPTAPALLVWDAQSELARLLRATYERCLPTARSIEFDALAPAAILAAFEALPPRSLVVLIQSTSFRLDAYRIRLELFRRGLAVIEHPHLARITSAQTEFYVDALAYERDYYRDTGAALKERIDRAHSAVIVSDGEQLCYSAGLEPAKLNVGDYRALTNRGGQFPIGEVFTESKLLDAVSGRVRIAAFGDRRFEVNRPTPSPTLIIDRGRVIDAHDSTPELDAVLATIRADETDIRLRELGFGLNRAFSPTRVVNDIGAFERMCGVHLSLGAKHATYPKPEITKSLARHHVDIFVATDSVWLDDERVFTAGRWCVGL